MQQGSMHVFAGTAYKKGYGLGRVTKSMMRQANPQLKQAGKQAVKIGLSVVAGILGKRRSRSRPPAWANLVAACPAQGCRLHHRSAARLAAHPTVFPAAWGTCSYPDHRPIQVKGGYARQCRTSLPTNSENQTASVSQCPDVEECISWLLYILPVVNEANLN